MDQFVFGISSCEMCGYVRKRAQGQPGKAETPSSVSILISRLFPISRLAPRGHPHRASHAPVQYLNQACNSNMGNGPFPMTKHSCATTLSPKTPRAKTIGHFANPGTPRNADSFQFRRASNRGRHSTLATNRFQFVLDPTIESLAQVSLNCLAIAAGQGSGLGFFVRANLGRADVPRSIAPLS